jgi:hypothetical protein
MTLALGLEQALCNELNGLDCIVTSYRIQAYVSMFNVGILLVGRKVNL